MLAPGLGSTFDRLFTAPNKGHNQRASTLADTHGSTFDRHFSAHKYMTISMSACSCPLANSLSIVPLLRISTLKLHNAQHKSQSTDCRARSEKHRFVLQLRLTALLSIQTSRRTDTAQAASQVHLFCIAEGPSRSLCLRLVQVSLRQSSHPNTSAVRNILTVTHHTKQLHDQSNDLDPALIPGDL